MTTYYVGSGGNDSNAGTSWAQRKLTLNGVEDIPVAAGDTVYVAPGVYRETLTVDVSGIAGSVISYIGDYDGSHTDGVGGVVRITGSDNDQTATRANCITATTKDYRTFRGFVCDGTSSHLMSFSGCAHIVVDQMHTVVWAANTVAVGISGAAQLDVTVSNVFAVGGYGLACVSLVHSAFVSDAGHVISNCILMSSQNGTVITVSRVGGITIKNCLMMQGAYGVGVTVPDAGQTIVVNNCIFMGFLYALNANVLGYIIEDYNTFSTCANLRQNVDIGAHSIAYPPLFDSRWFFELVNGGSMVSPFDLASYSQLINVAGTSPTTTDMRGTAKIGAERELGALEYDPTLKIEASAGGGGRPAFGDRTGGKF